MTAVIGILNRHGVALAADSAVTISGGNGRKIYNSAYKIFTLSKFHPVSIMIYNSATFMQIPWEILIKEYRKELSDKEFNCLVDYQTNFIKYLKSKLHLVSKDYQELNIAGFIEYIQYDILERLTNNFVDDIDRIKTQKGKKEFIREKLIAQVDDLYKNQSDEEKLDEFKDYAYVDFKRRYAKHLYKFFKEFYQELDVPNKTEDLIYKIIHQLIISNVFLGNWTGLVFAGFGKKEIYPACIPINIGEVVDNRIRYALDKDNVAIINHDLSASIRPFAQRDVIDIILSGIDDNLEQMIYKSFNDVLEEFVSILTNTLGGNQKIVDKLNNIDIKELVEFYSDNFQNLKNEYHIDPLMSSIASLSKEDLAELAESLVYLTYLKRRMSFSEESVGGPIDVALITKGDGFVWMKRKHYFSSELNQDFIYKYINK